MVRIVLISFSIRIKWIDINKVTFSVGESPNDSENCKGRNPKDVVSEKTHRI